MHWAAQHITCCDLKYCKFLFLFHMALAEKQLQHNWKPRKNFSSLVRLHKILKHITASSLIGSSSVLASISFMSSSLSDNSCQPINTSQRFLLFILYTHRSILNISSPHLCKLASYRYSAEYCTECNMHIYSCIFYRSASIKNGFTKECHEKRTKLSCPTSKK
jgi:hypothetical protein